MECKLLIKQEVKILRKNKIRQNKSKYCVKEKLNK